MTPPATAPAEGTPVIAKSDRIPLLQKIMFSAGGSMDYFATGLTINVLWLPYFNIGMGMNPALVGLALMILRGWDAFLDPFIGNISDNARTPWGRRRPFMVVGAVLTAALFPWLWRPPAFLGPTGVTVYLVLVGMIFFFFFSCWSMPYYGLQLELTPSYDERTRLSAWMALFSKLTSLIGSWSMAIVTGSWFASAVTGKPDLVHGVRTCSWFLAGMILFFGLLPPLFVPERYYDKEASHQTRDSFWQSIRESFHCRPLWDLIGISFFLVLGSTMVGTLGQYVNIYYINDGRIAPASIIDGWRGTASLVTGILCIPLWTWLGGRLDKKTMVLLLFGGGLFGHLLNLLCLRPGLPYLQLIPSAFQSGVLAAIWLFLPSMKADVSDYDELQTTRRREGALNAFYSWFIKAALTCALGLGGVALQWSGINVKLGPQSHEVVTRLTMMYLLLPLALWSGAAYFIWHYPLGRQRMHEIRAQLELRRGRL